MFVNLDLHTSFSKRYVCTFDPKFDVLLRRALGIGSNSESKDEPDQGEVGGLMLILEIVASWHVAPRKGNATPLRGDLYDPTGADEELWKF